MGQTKRRSVIGLSVGATGACNELIATIWLLRQGYEVLRNVSPHGPVDIVGIKDGVVHLFDVKAKHVNAGGIKDGRVRLSQEQIDLGVKGLAVFPDGSCQIDETPQLKNIIRQCPSCGKGFGITRYFQVYCGRECMPSAIKRRAERAAIRENSTAGA